MLSRIALLAATAAVSACGGGADSELALRQHGYSESYVAGFHDGCPSGKNAGGDYLAKNARNAEAYGINDEYRTGWEYGFVNCKQDYERQAKIASAIGTAFAAGMSTHGADGADAKAAMDGIDVDELNSSLKAAGW